MWDTAISELKQSVNIDSYSIAKAWKLRKELDPNGLGTDYNTLQCLLDCDQCQCECTYAVETGNEIYVNCLWTTKDWFSTEFIAGFMTMILNDVHMTKPPFKTEDWIMMVSTPYPNKPILEILGYGDRTHFVCVVFNTDHFAVLYYDIAKCTVTVFDGLNASIKNWQVHIIHTIKLYGMQMPLALSMCKYWENLGHDEYGRRTRDMEMEICFEETSTHCLVNNERAYIQSDRYNCGPIACLKVIEIYGFLPVGPINVIKESVHGYQPVVMDYFNSCVMKYNTISWLSSKKDP